MERVETAVIGAGQAGLATSYFLTQHDREHVVLERGRGAETWRSQRWDGFYLNTPNSVLRLPGFHYQGDEPNGFLALAEVIEYIEGYARSFSAPVREHVQVAAVRINSAGYVLETSAGTIGTANVVVATGAFQQPRPRLPGADHVPGVLQLTTSEYRRPEQISEGSVLVVGGGQSGCQITDELLRAGRTVYLSTGSCPWMPRRYRGRDILLWFDDLGRMDERVDSLPSPAARLACNPPISGNNGGHDCHPRWLAGQGAHVVGRLSRIEGSAASFEPGLEEKLVAGDEFAADLMSQIDRLIAERGLDTPDAEPRDTGPSPLVDTPEVDLHAAGISTIVWATGFRPDYSWIELDVADEYGWPMQERGVSTHPGLYFIGVNWLYKRKSALFRGVGDDAEHVVAHLVTR
jgi:putative flavoprotein involved in K+ transport